jgi:ribosome-associated toxin RatA of RatAB toxin-antitoxin module
VLIEASFDFEGDPEMVWKKVSDVEKIPEYWHGTKSLRVLETVDGVKRVAAVKFAFGGLGKAEITTDSATKTLQLKYLSGPFTGTQTVRIVGKNLEAKWEIDFHGIFRIGSGRTAGHFKSGTVHALERLAGKSEADLPEQSTTLK